MIRISAWKITLLPALAGLFLAVPTVWAAKIRVLFVGGDWKSQLPEYITNAGYKYLQKHPVSWRSALPPAISRKVSIPMRGYFVRKVVDKFAPGRFKFTLWTSYQFLQYGDAESLKKFDVIVCGGMQGESMVPRLIAGVKAFVKGGGGLMYADSVKNFSSYRRKWSFNAVLPIVQMPFKPYGPGLTGQPLLNGPIKLQVVRAQNPIMRGLNFSTAPALLASHYGQVKKGAVVLAKAPGGTPLWVEWSYGKGRVLYPGGVFSNDDYSKNFANWPQFGQFYAQALSWLTGHCTYPAIRATNAVATGTLTVNLTQPGPTISARLFGVDGQNKEPGMPGNADLALFKALKLNGSFDRSAGFGAIEHRPHGTWYQRRNDGTSLTHFDWNKYNFSRIDGTLATTRKLKMTPLFLYGMPWPYAAKHTRRWTKYCAAIIEHINGVPGTPAYHRRLRYFELMNEPSLGPPASVLTKYCQFFNDVAGHLHQRYPGMMFGGCGGFEYPYDDEIIARCGKNMNWISRHPYGLTGEAVFDLQDEFMKYARSLGFNHLKFIITEWDFWVYGRPAFDYIMQRWLPVVNHATTCLGTLQYRWREYDEGGYNFGVIGQFNQRYGQLPPQWPNPGLNKPITYRYNAFWIMRNCRGTRYATKLNIPALKTSPTPYAYAITTSNRKQFNIVIYYGYPYTHLAAGKRYTGLRLHVDVPIPSRVRGRTLVLARANARSILTAVPVKIHGNRINMKVSVPALSAVSLTVK